MKNGLNKFGKGMFAIFTIKVVLFSLIFIVQACENNINEPENVAKEDFLSALRESSYKINNISAKKIDFSDTQARDLTDGTIVIDENVTKLCLDEPVDDTGSTGGDLTLGEIIALDINILNDKDFDIDEVGNYCYEVSEEEAIESLNPAIVQAKEYFYSFGFSDNDIIEMLDGKDESNLVLLVAGIIASENSNNNTSSTDNFEPNLFGISTVISQENPNFADKSWSCFWEATGIGAFSEVFDAVKSANKAILKKVGSKALKKLAKKFLGPIGIAIAVVEFSFCMNR